MVQLSEFVSTVATQRGIMTKRHNPFDDNFCPFKIHVREKEVNMGVNFQQRMKAVYGKLIIVLSFLHLYILFSLPLEQLLHCSYCMSWLNPSPKVKQDCLQCTKMAYKGNSLSLC